MPAIVTRGALYRFVRPGSDVQGGCCANGDGPAFTCAYDGKLGRARISDRGVITMTGVEDIDLQALADMITAIETGLATGQLVAR
jgi:hypothetical protein